MTSISKLYEPSPRFGHGAALVRERCYLRGGCVPESGRRKLASTVEIFDPYLETWEEHPTTGVPPPGLHNGACTSLLDSLYWFGGWDGRFNCNSFHRLDTTTLKWRELQPLNQVDGPMRKGGCGMVSIFQNKLAMFGGHGIPTSATQPGAMFTKDTRYTDGRGWSNELHVFNITEDKWSSPPTTGPRPPPSTQFSFTAINNHQAVLFGGRQPHGRVNDCYLMNFESMEWTKLERPEGTPWPVERSAHAACCLNYGEENPHLLVTGGVDKDGNTLQDAWILDVNSGRWRELTFPKGAQPRIWHTVTALSLGPGRTQVTMFGGCPKWEWGKTDDVQQKLAETTVLEFESVELTMSGDGAFTREWVLVGVADSSQLGSPKRLAELEKMKQRKAEYEREREIKELKERVHQLEKEKISAQRQTRLALARAVRAEIETDKVPVLEQQLSQTKTNLEGQIQMKDQARIAAEQQLQQTKATLEHEIQMAEQQFNQEKAGLQHEIQERDQKISSLQQQIHQTEKFLEHHKQAAVSAQQQFSHRVKNLEHQIEVTEQARVALEMQIQARDREKAELEHLLHQKEEHIRAKDREKAKLEHQLHQKDEQIQARDREKAELEHQLHQKEEHIQAKDREKAELEHQLHQKEEQIQAKDRENAKLEHQLHQKKEHIQGKDREKAELEHQLHRKEEQIQARDREKAKLEHELYQKEEQIQGKDREKAELEHQLHRKEEQIQARDREKAKLEHELYQKEEQIQAKDREKAKLEHQLHQKEEQIRAKDREKVELEHQICQIKEHRPPEVTQVVEVQQEGSEYVTAQGALPSVHEDHEAEPSRLTHEGTAKKQEIEVELKAQIIQAGEDLQQQLKAKDIEIIAIRRESQHNQDTLEALTDENKEMAAQINFLEAKLVKLEFLEGVSSQEVDQLREELMDKEVEIDYLRNEQAHTTPTTTATSSPLSHLRGAEVVAETTFTLTPEARSFEFTGYGFKLHVPDGSLPAEVSETQLNVRVSLSGQFQLPPNCELISAVYWVSSRCPHKFTKPLVVEIQHCAALSSDEQCEQLTFVRTVCTQKELPYTFTEEGGVFSYHSSYGSLSLSHFSGLGVGRRRGGKVHRPHKARPAPYRVQPASSTSGQTIQVQPQQAASEQTTDTVPSDLSPHSEGNVEGSEQDEEIFDHYCGQVYIKREVNDCRVYFVITRNLDAHRTIVREFYSTRMQVKEDIEMGLEFGEDKYISLAIPRIGIILQSGWKIIPRYKPMIRKANVDHFSHGGMIPKCELLLRWQRGDKPHVCLEHDIELTGAKDYSYFTLYIPDAVADIPTPSPAAAVEGGWFSPSMASSPKGGGPETKKPVLKDLTNAFYHKVADKWKVIGVLLEIPKGKLSRIADKHRDPCSCLVEMLETWLGRVHPPPTWAAIIEAIEFLGEEQLGKDLRFKYCPTVCK